MEKCKLKWSHLVAKYIYVCKGVIIKINAPEMELKMYKSIEDKILAKMIEYFENDVRRINHALKVYGFAKSIASGETLSSDENISISISAILHDIGIKESERKYNSSGAKYQEIEGPPIALEIMNSLNLSSDIIERVCFVIGNHHTYSKIDNIDFQILVEADFLVNIHEDTMDLEAIEKIKTKYFKTKIGKIIIENLYK